MGYLEVTLQHTEMATEAALHTSRNFGNREVPKGTSHEDQQAKALPYKKSVSRAVTKYLEER